MIFHLALAGDWDAGEPEYRVSTVGRTLDEAGFIHCSYESQVEATADLFYRGRSGVMLLTIDPALVEAEIRVEDGFPHVYGPIPRAAVVATQRLVPGPDGRLLPGR